MCLYFSFSSFLKKEIQSPQFAEKAKRNGRIPLSFKQREREKESIMLSFLLYFLLSTFFFPKSGALLSKVSSPHGEILRKKIDGLLKKGGDFLRTVACHSVQRNAIKKTW